MNLGTLMANANDAVMGENVYANLLPRSQSVPPMKSTIDMAIHPAVPVVRTQQVNHPVTSEIAPVSNTYTNRLKDPVHSGELQAPRKTMRRFEEDEIETAGAEEKKKKKREKEKRSKRSKTLFTKTESVLKENVFTEALTIIKDSHGRWLMTGSADLENAVIQGRPLIDIAKCNIYKYSTSSIDAELSFEENTEQAGSVQSPLKLPTPIKNSVPGGAESVINLAKEFIPSIPAPLRSPKMSTKNKRKKKPVAGKASQPKRAYRKKVKTASLNNEQAQQPGPSTLAQPRDDDVCCFSDCEVEYEVGQRWIQCEVCDGWACGSCSRTTKLKKTLVDKIGFKCEKCKV